ncbi:hypothetical protein [Thermomonospora cellulosilytica]|uniref:DUF3558 domain-containing protein n=1 Tax=Thermomonospora cellulosilytica TaxID=1411118 RepID=A0A7W3N503_9ACTN|nr:hypothetical protein [Thermomonospora cellulosilytica]MBA9007615.1 hypothetical protein [Thermomonospora cellulosilytica]
MGLPRPPEDFDRIYSPPEPPAPARRSRRFTLLLAAGAVAAVAAVALVLLPGGDPGGGAAPGGTASPAPVPDGTSGSPHRRYSALPPACGTVSERTVRRLVPDGRPTSSGNATFGYCGYGSASGEARWLSVDLRLYTAVGAFTPEQSAQRHFDIKWTLAGRSTEERTVTLEALPGLGDQAYRWFKVDRHRPLAIGEVAVRTGNVVVTAGYSEPVAGTEPSPRQRERCLAEAAAIAREVLGRLG